MNKVISERKKNSKHWSESEKDVIRANYKGYGAAVKCSRLLKQMGFNRTDQACQGQAKVLGMQTNISCFFEPWTAKEDGFILDTSNLHSKYWQAKQLHRTVGAVANRRKYLRVSEVCKDGWYSKREVEHILGIYGDSLLNIINSGSLKGTRIESDAQKPYWQFLDSDIYKFITTYPMALQGRNCDMFQIINILTKGGIKHNGVAI